MKKIILIHGYYMAVDKIKYFRVSDEEDSLYSLNVYMLGNDPYYKGEGDKFCFYYNTKEEAEADLNRLIKAIEGEDDE